MPEETGQTTTTSAQTQTASQSADPAAASAASTAAEPTSTESQDFDFTKAIGPDGKLLDGWKKGLPEDLQNELSLDTFQDFPEAMRQLVGAQKMIGKDKIVIPNEKSTQAEWDAFYSRLGRPKTPGEYKYTPPTDLSLVDMSPEMMNPILSDFHKAGYSQKQMDVALGHFQKYLGELERSIEAEDNAEFEEADQIIADYLAQSGQTLEDQKHEALLLIAENSPNDEFQEKLKEALNESTLRPYVYNFLADIHRKYFSSHEGMPAGAEPGVVSTPATMRLQAQELQATPGYMDGSMKNTNPAQYQRLTKQITDLFNRADMMDKSK